MKERKGGEGRKGKEKRGRRKGREREEKGRAGMEGMGTESLTYVRPQNMLFFWVPENASSLP
jgi:hypothetical protein